MRVAVYTIALNEIKHVERWVKSNSGADDLFVLDTGSTDGTVEKLRELGVTVQEATINPWRFDIARNTALSLLPNDVDVCVSIDMDEVPAPDFFIKLRKQWKKNANKGWVFMDTGTQWATDRIHSRHGYYWVSPIHEVISPSMGTKIKPCSIETYITHKPDDSKSRAKYLPMLKAAVEEDPKDQRMLVYLVREYYFHAQWQKVIDTTNKLLPDHWDRELAQSYRLAGWSAVNLNDLKQAGTWFNNAVDACKDSIESWTTLAQYHYHAKDWAECERTSREALTKEVTTDYMADPSCVWRANDLLSLALWELENRQDALKYAKIALNLNPTDKRLKANVDFYKKVLLNS